MRALFERKKWPSTAEAVIDGSPVTVTVRVNQRSRNYRLSLPHARGPLLTVPPHGNWHEAEAFLNRHIDWLAVRLERAAVPVVFAPGAVIPLRGVHHRIVPTGRLRGRVEVREEDEAPVLAVPGESQHHARRLTDWLKAEAHRDLEACVAVHAGRLGVTVKSIAMRSQATRWGSCSSSGRLNFNWRLVLAPPFVLDYVAAHEVAHLVEMNHSERFWATVERTLPAMERGRAWLRAHGRELMAYGMEG